MRQPSRTLLTRLLAVETEADALAASTRNAITALSKFHQDYDRAVATARRLGSTRQSVQMVGLKSRQISHQNAPMLSGAHAVVRIAWNGYWDTHDDFGF